MPIALYGIKRQCVPCMREELASCSGLTALVSKQSLTVLLNYEQLLHIKYSFNKTGPHAGAPLNM